MGSEAKAHSLSLDPHPSPLTPVSPLTLTLVLRKDVFLRVGPLDSRSSSRSVSPLVPCLGRDGLKEEGGGRRRHDLGAQSSDHLSCQWGQLG